MARTPPLKSQTLRRPTPGCHWDSSQSQTFSPRSGFPLRRQTLRQCGCSPSPVLARSPRISPVPSIQAVRGPASRRSPSLRSIPRPRLSRRGKKACHLPPTPFGERHCGQQLPRDSGRLHHWSRGRQGPPIQSQELPQGSGNRHPLAVSQPCCGSHRHDTTRGGSLKKSNDRAIQEGCLLKPARLVATRTRLEPHERIGGGSNPIWNIESSDPQ